MHLKNRYIFKKKSFIITFSALFFVLLLICATLETHKLLNNFLLSVDFRPKIFNVSGNNIIPKEYIIETICNFIQNNGSSKKCFSKWNTLYVSAWEIRNLLEKSSNWIKEITVMRQIPDTFHIKIEEYTPFAVWNNNVILDLNGNKIDDKEFILKKGKYLIQVKSSSIDPFVSLISSIKQNDSLIQNIKSLDFINERRWNLTLKNNTLIKLPEKNPGNTILKLIKLHRDIFENRDIKIIDIRIQEKTFITEQ